MKPETAEWTAKADADLATAQREAAVDDSPNYDAAESLKAVAAIRDAVLAIF